jgi:hypothetical protein
LSLQAPLAQPCVSKTQFRPTPELLQCSYTWSHRHPINSSNPAATAVVRAYNTTGGNPTIGGTATFYRAGNLTVSPTATTTFAQDRLVWNFGTAVSQYDQNPTIPPSTTEQFCLNLGASSLTAVLEGSIEWTEE